MKYFPAFTLLALLVFARPLLAAEMAPPLVVPTLKGATFDLSALRGHPVIVNFWATWCVPCRVEMPLLSNYYLNHKADGLEIIGISVDSPRDLPKVKVLADTVSYPIAVARDAEKNGFPTANALPLTYLIDANGVVRAKLAADSEALTEQSLAALVAPLLKKP